MQTKIKNLPYKNKITKAAWFYHRNLIHKKNITALLSAAHRKLKAMNTKRACDQTELAPSSG